MEIYLIGCGGNAKVVIDICELLSYKIIGIFDDRYGEIDDNFYGKYHLVGKIDDIPFFGNINIINTIGDCFIRNRIYEKLKILNLNWINCIHPQSYISPSAKLGYGNIVCYGAIINSDAIVGNFNLINTYAIIEHDCVIGDFNHIAPKATMCGAVHVGNLNLLGAGTTIIPTKRIGNNNIIGAATLIIKNFSDNLVIVGVPGKSISNS